MLAPRSKRAPVPSIHLDVRRLDDWPPAFGLVLLIRAQGLRRLLGGGRDLNAEFGKTLLHLGSASTFIMVAFSLATMSSGVSFGTHRPYQSEAKNPVRPPSSAVGMSGDDG